MNRATISALSGAPSGSKPGTKPPVYTTAGTIYNPSLSLPLQAPIRRGRAVKLPALASSDLDRLSLLAKGSQGGAYNHSHEAQITPPYQPLQQNLDKAAKPATSDTSSPDGYSRGSQMSAIPTGPRYPTTYQGASRAPRAVNRPDGEKQEIGGKSLDQLPTKALFNLMRYPNPNQEFARQRWQMAKGGGLGPTPATSAIKTSAPSNPLGSGLNPNVWKFYRDERKSRGRPGLTLLKHEDGAPATTAATTDSICASPVSLAAYSGAPSHTLNIATPSGHYSTSGPDGSLGLDAFGNYDVLAPPAQHGHASVVPSLEAAAKGVTQTRAVAPRADLEAMAAIGLDNVAAYAPRMGQRIVWYNSSALPALSTMDGSDCYCSAQAGPHKTTPGCHSHFMDAVPAKPTSTWANLKHDMCAALEEAPSDSISPILKMACKALEKYIGSGMYSDGLEQHKLAMAKFGQSKGSVAKGPDV